MGDSLVSWKTKKQSTVSHSSAKAKYHDLAAVSSEITWIFQVLMDLPITSPIPALIYCDSQATISIAPSSTFHERTKHIEIDCHFVRDKITCGVLKLLPVRSFAQLAYMFTKALPFSVLKPFILKMGIFNLHCSSWGGVEYY